MSAYSGFPHALGPAGKEIKQLLGTVWTQLKLAKLQLHSTTGGTENDSPPAVGAKVTHEVIVYQTKARQDNLHHNGESSSNPIRRRQDKTGGQYTLHIYTAEEAL
jgi:hypothetical protein